MAKHFVTLLWVSAALTATLALPTSEKISGSENDLMTSIYADCLKEESINCIKYKVFTFVDKMLADKEDITLSEGITVVKTSSAEGEGAPRSIESSDFDTLLFDRLGRFLRTHSVKVDLKGSDILGAIESAGRSFEDFSDNAVESRGKKSNHTGLSGQRQLRYESPRRPSPSCEHATMMMRKPIPVADVDPLKNWFRFPLNLLD